MEFIEYSSAAKHHALALATSKLSSTIGCFTISLQKRSQGSPEFVVTDFDNEFGYAKAIHSQMLNFNTNS